MKKINQILLITGLVSCFTVTVIIGQTPVNQPLKTTNNILAVGEDYSLVIENVEGKITKLGLSDFQRLKRQTVKVNDHEKAAAFEGYVLADVLKLAGIELGDKMRGKELAKFLLVKAADNYQVVFALAELEPAFTDKIVLVADKRDGQILSQNEGPLRLIVAGEKKAGRWVRQIISLKIINAYVESK